MTGKKEGEVITASSPAALWTFVLDVNLVEAF